MLTKRIPKIGSALCRNMSNVTPLNTRSPYHKTPSFSQSLKLKTPFKYNSKGSVRWAGNLSTIFRTVKTIKFHISQGILEYCKRDNPFNLQMVQKKSCRIYAQNRVRMLMKTGRAILKKPMFRCNQTYLHSFASII